MNLQTRPRPKESGVGLEIIGLIEVRTCDQQVSRPCHVGRYDSDVCVGDRAVLHRRGVQENAAGANHSALAQHHKLIGGSSIDDKGVGCPWSAIEDQVYHTRPGHLKLLVDGERKCRGTDCEQVVTCSAVVDQGVAGTAAGLGKG